MASAFGREISDGQNVGLFADLSVHGATQRCPSLEAQLRFTLNVIPAFTWYAAPSGALTFVNQRCADYLGLSKDHPLRLGSDMGAEWDSHILFYILKTVNIRVAPGQFQYARAAPLRKSFEFVTLKECTGGSSVAQNLFWQAMEVCCTG